MSVHFLLICEGSSDAALVPHLRSLLVDCGAREAIGAAPDFSLLEKRVPRDIGSRVRVALNLEGHVDLLFVHRDADSPDAQPRYNEISEGITQAGYASTWIGVVPVQETEAWLLLDESAIRRVSGRPRGRVVLNLPTPNHVEELAHPKECLFEELVRASETTGRQRDRLKRKLPLLRAQLLRELKLGGSLQSVPSWMLLRNDVAKYVRSLNER
jgi:hypothetical protein